MTHQEHQLMVWILARQIQMVKALEEGLKSAGIWNDTDFRAFVSLATNFTNTSDDLISSAEKQYREIALKLGVDIPAKIV